MDLAPQGPNSCIFFDFSGLEPLLSTGLKLTGQEGCVGLRRESVDFPDIQKVETLILVISALNRLLFMVFLRNSSFTGSVGLIIASSRSGTSFSSCLASSIYFPITKKCLFLGSTLFLCHRDPDANPLQPISGPCSIGKYPSSRMANRYARIFDAGGLDLYAQLGVCVFAVAVLQIADLPAA